MERTRVLKPGSSLTDINGPSYYDIKDLYVGGRIEVLSHSFVLLDADEYVFNFMESDPARFKFSNVQACHQKISAQLKNLGAEQKQGLVQALQRADPAGTHCVDRQVLVQLAKSLFAPGTVTDHVI